MNQTAAVLALLVALLACWMVSQFDPWVGRALGAFVVIVACVFLIASREMRASDNSRVSSDDRNDAGD